MNNSNESKEKFRILKSIGPAFIVASVVLGPGSISTSSRAGASHGFAMIWVILLAAGLMMGLVALYFRWKTIDPRLKPRRWWDIMLVLSFLGFLTIGVYLTITKGRQFLEMLNAWLG